jgi:hypothetical protein
MVRVLRELLDDDDFALEVLEGLDADTRQGIEDLADLREELRN